MIKLQHERAIADILRKLLEARDLECAQSIKVDPANLPRCLVGYLASPGHFQSCVSEKIFYERWSFRRMLYPETFQCPPTRTSITHSLTRRIVLSLTNLLHR